MLKLEVLDKQTIEECINEVKKLALKLGISQSDSAIFSVGVSEALVNANRYANGSEITIDFTDNHKGIEVIVKDNGQGIENLQECKEDGFSTSLNSLGLGFGAMKRSSDEFLILQNDATGLSLSLRKYLNKPVYQSAEVSIKKEGESFNGDSTIILDYDGDTSLFVVLDGAGHGEKASHAALNVKDTILENYRLSLHSLLALCHENLLNSESTRAVDIAMLRIKNNIAEYLLLGNTFIKKFPGHPFISNNGSIGLKMPENLKVETFTLEEKVCISLCSDGIDSAFQLYSLYEEHSAKELATTIFNNYNVNDDSSIIVVKK